MIKWFSMAAALFLVIALSVTLGYALTGDNTAEEHSRAIAEGYLASSPTFALDGMEDTLVLVQTQQLDCPLCWAFEFEFQCRHAGYGYRWGQVLAEVITPHTARIVVEQGQVTQATMDDVWDTMEQQMILQ